MLNESKIFIVSTSSKHYLDTTLIFTNTCYEHINKYIIAYIHKKQETEISEI